MKLLTLIIVAFLSTSFADRIDDIEAEIANLEATKSQIQKELQALRQSRSVERRRDGKVGPFITERSANPDALAEIQRLNGKIADLKEERADLNQSLRRLRQEERAEERKIAQAQADAQRAARAEERERQRQERDAKRDAERAEREERRRQDLEARELNFLRQKLRRIDVESDLSEIDYDTLSAETELAELRSAYDRSLLGAYLQEKVALLLESDLMCESVNSCAANGTNPKSVKDFNKKLRDQVFPDTQQRESQPARSRSESR